MMDIEEAIKRLVVIVLISLVIIFVAKSMLSKAAGVAIKKQAVLQQQQPVQPLSPPVPAPAGANGSNQ
jgi:hypothetical protein